MAEDSCNPEFVFPDDDVDEDDKDGNSYRDERVNWGKTGEQKRTAKYFSQPSTS